MQAITDSLGNAKLDLPRLAKSLHNLRDDDMPDDALVGALREELDKGGGEVILCLHDGPTPDDTRVSLPVPYAQHGSCYTHLLRAAESLNACVSLQTSTPTETTLLVRMMPHTAEDHIEVRIAIVGNVDAGKSTLLGVLTKGMLDDGRGRARVDLFRHKHEFETGRTSSVGTEIMGFYADGHSVVDVHPTKVPGRKVAWEDVCGVSAKMISFIDLAGHERYLKTTVFGMTSCLPDYVILMVGANAGLIGMSKEHLGIALALNIPVVVVVTKVDMCPPQVYENTMRQLHRVLQSPGCRKTPVSVTSEEMVVETAMQLPIKRICPIFTVSNVTGQHLNLLRQFLNLAPSSQAQYAPLQSAPVEMPISDVFSVPFVGTVVSGVLTAGVVRTGDALLLGPDSLGQFMPTAVRSIQRKRVGVECASAGQSVSFALKRVRRSQVRKGMLLLARTNTAPSVHREFEAEVLCLYHSTTLSVGSCIVLHASSIRQTVKIVALAKQGGVPSSRTKVALNAADDTRPVVRMGDRARVRLRFMNMAEYITPGTRLIAREGKTKLVGMVRSVGAQGTLANARPERNVLPESGSAGPALHVPTQLSGTA